MDKLVSYRSKPGFNSFFNLLVLQGLIFCYLPWYMFVFLLSFYVLNASFQSYLRYFDETSETRSPAWEAIWSKILLTDEVKCPTHLWRDLGNSHFTKEIVIFFYHIPVKANILKTFKTIGCILVDCSAGL